MKRKITSDLNKWKNSFSNMPYMVVGARQVGKTYIIDEFCKKNFSNYIYINLEKDDAIKNIFERTIKPEEIIEGISIYMDVEITSDTVIFFDEIQVSERAITSLKYFNESEINYNIICAGSLLGVALNRFKNSYPVGKVRKVILNPMDFEEFLWAIGKKALTDKIEESFRTNERMIYHDIALKLYKDYLYVGGMPKSILEYINKDKNILKYDRAVKLDIIDAYIIDMNKYTTSSENIKINKLYKSIPRQLSKENTKFTYKIIEDKSNKKKYETSIEWLLNSNLAYKCILVQSPELPLTAYEKDNIFKIYLNDVGLLCELSKLTPKNLFSEDFFRYKGMLTENYVAQTFYSNQLNLNYWRSKQEAEVDFIINYEGNIIPVEVKSAENTKAKSLKVYVEKYKPKYAIKISTKNFGFYNNIKSIPLYAVYLLKDNS